LQYKFIIASASDDLIAITLYLYQVSTVVAHERDFMRIGR